MSVICVYCGSSSGAQDKYAEAAAELGFAIADAGHALVYGGGHVGLMGTVADAVLSRGGRATGVIPKHLADKEVAHGELTELLVVDGMHTRKQTMAELADCFLALPGGVGTLEEIVEVFVWSQLGLHNKPCGFLNTLGYYDGLLSFFEHMESQSFLKSFHRDQLLVSDCPRSIVERISTVKVGYADKWHD